MIFGYIKGQTLELHYDKIVSESVDYLTAEFNFFTNEWESFTKWAHFKKSDQVFDVLLEDNKINKNAHLNLSAGEWEVYLHGNSDTGERITTNVAHIKVEPTGVLNGEPLPEIPLSVAEQVAALAQRAVEVAESVRTDADNGVFDGEQGDDYVLTEHDREEIAKKATSEIKEELKDKADLIDGKVPEGQLPDNLLNKDNLQETINEAISQQLDKDKNGQVDKADDTDKLGGKPPEYYAASKDIPSIPKKVSEFENDAGYLTSFTETDPTVPSWAKTSEKPVYTPAEIGAEPNGTASSAVSSHNTDDLSHNDIRLLVNALTERLNALADSDDTTLDQMSEIVAYIKSNKELLYDVTTNKISYADVIDNLVTNVGGKPLSAAQGVVLKALFDTLSNDINNELLKKADVEVMNEKLLSKSNTGHSHDDIYYRKQTVDNLLSNKASYSHNHDNLYLSKQETNNALDSKQDKLTFDTVPTEGSSNPVTSDGINKAVNEAIEVAYGKKKAYVFDTVEQLDIWLTYTTNIEKLSTGDAFYIRATDAPDYWWDSDRNTKQILETTKVDLSEYAEIEYVNTELEKKAEKEHIHDDRYTTKEEISSALLLKADLVDGIVPKSQLPNDIGVQADWNVADETSPAYVRNKTHGIVGTGMGYTLNDDGTYIPVDTTKDSEFPSGSWYTKFVYVSDKVYTVEELLGRTIKTKEIYLGDDTRVYDEYRDIEITADLVTQIADGWAILDDDFPVIAVISESIAGIDVGFGFPLPSNPGTYLVYADKNPERQGYVFGSYKVGIGEEVKTLDPMYLPPVNEIKGFTEEINKVTTAVNNHNTDTLAHNDIRSILSTLNQKIEAFLNTDDTTLDQLSEIVAYIKNNKTLIDNITTSKVNVSDIIDNLTTNIKDKPLSASMGVALKALIDAIVVPTKTSQLTNDSGFLTQHQSLAGYAKSTDIPTKVSQLTNDAKYLTSVPAEYVTETELEAKGYAKTSQIPSIPSSLPANGGNADTVGGYRIVVSNTEPTVNDPKVITIVI